MTRSVSTVQKTLKRLRIPLTLTRLGMISENLARAFWPLWSVLIVAVGLLMLGVQDQLGVEFVWALAFFFTLSAIWAGVHGAMRFRWPRRHAALERLDDSLKGRPLQTLMDDQVIGTGDDASRAVWRAHQARMAERAGSARAVRPDLKISALDPFGLRYCALLVFSVALLFGSVTRVASVSDMAPGGRVVATGPMWEGWVEPPAYTGKPALYLNDLEGDIRVPQGSLVTLRLYGEAGALMVRETISGKPVEGSPVAVQTGAQFDVAQSGELAIDGPGGRVWTVTMEPDRPPRVNISAQTETELDGTMLQRFYASDDYAVTGGSATILLDLENAPRHHGLAVAAEPRDALLLDLPLPFNGDRSGFEETIVENYAEHAWANLPITLQLEVTDELGQTGQTSAFRTVLPGRRFFDPMAAAVIEQRRDLLWNRSNGARVAQILRAVSHRAESAFRSETAYLRLRVILRRIEAFSDYGMTLAQQDEIAQALWDLAVDLEEGDLSDALDRLRRAQERLSEAIRNGASEDEIAELMQEMREASRDYIRQLSRQAQQDSQGEGEESQSAQNNSDGMQMTQDDLQRMMDRIQELMEQGRMAEAQQALQELQEMMENMRVTQGQGQGGESAGDQAMEGLSETLREQQGLSDQAFRDLQEQFNPGARAGESQGNEGQRGGQGRGQSHDPQDGTGQGQGNGDGQQPGEPGETGSGGETRESLADRQRALRQELQRQQNALPGLGGETGDAVRRSLDQAEGAMEGAEEALRQDDLAEAIDRQAEAMDALRDGIRNLGEALAQQQQQGQQGTAEADANSPRRDPLGRNPGTNGQIGTDENLLQGEDVYRRARELLDEIRRRSGDGNRPEVELDYLKRLLERF